MGRMGKDLRLYANPFRLHPLLSWLKLGLVAVHALAVRDGGAGLGGRLGLLRRCLAASSAAFAAFRANNSAAVAAKAVQEIVREFAFMGA